MDFQRRTCRSSFTDTVLDVRDRRGRPGSRDPAWGSNVFTQGPNVPLTTNEAVERFLSKLLKARVEIVQGGHSRAKTVRVHGLTLADLKAKLELQ